MKWLIALLTAATGILHLLVGLNIFAGMGSTSWMLVLNGLGYLVLLALFLTSSGSRRGTIRWILLAYTLITLVGYFIIGAGFGGETVWLGIKGIELLLVILLLFYREPAPVAAPAPARAAAPVTSTASRMAASVDTGVSAAGAAVAGAAAAVAATADKAVDEVQETAGEAADAAGDMVEDAGEAMGDMAEDAGEAMGEMAERAGDGIDAMGAAMAGAGAAAVAMASDAGEEVEEAMGMGDEAPEPSAADLRAELEEYLRSFGPSSEFRKEIEYIEGIGPAYGGKLRAAGVSTVLDLMVEGSTRTGRKHLADRSGLTPSQILTWVNHIDLFRIKGVAQEYADLLEQSGVDTVVELAQRNPNNLFKRMNEINEQKKLVRRTPHLSEVTSWVDQAKNLKRLIHY